jgi:hypothetical protein
MDIPKAIILQFHVLAGLEYLLLMKDDSKAKHNPVLKEKA